MTDISGNEIAELIQDTKQVLNPAEDVAKYREVAAVVRDASLKRRRENEAAEAHIATLTQSLNSLRANTTRSAADWKSASAHNAELDAMESTKFGLAKKINEQESHIAALEAQLRGKREEMQEVEKMDVESGMPFDKDAIALKIFQDLGFTANKNKTGTHDGLIFSSIFALSKSKTTAIAVDVDVDHMKTNGITPYILAEQLWKAVE